MPKNVNNLGPMCK